MKKNILICDANHGGLILLDEYSKYTENNLFFYDVYDKLTDRQKEKYSTKYNVRFLSLDDITSEYTVIAPVHMKPVVDIDYTHHEFTSYLVDKHKAKYDWNMKFIQVTGVKGKTTTVNLINNILKDSNRLVLTSNALIYYSKDKLKVLDESLSITPSSIITCLNIAKNEDILYEIDYFIIEVSLGVISNGNISVLTNILEDYPIACKTSLAHIAKESVFNSEVVIADKKSLDSYYNNHDAFSVSLNDKNADIYVKNVDYNISCTTFTVATDDLEFEISCFALTDFYINNILFAISVGLILDVEIENIQSSLKNMKSIPGRTSYKYMEDKLVIEEINPGLNTTSIKESVDNISRYDTSFTLILGGDYGITCEEIDEDKLLNYIKTIKNQNIIFTGDLGYSLYKNIECDKYLFIPDLNDALNYSLEKSGKIIEIIYRTEYSRKIEI